MKNVSRRTFLQTIGAACGLTLGASNLLAQTAAELPRVLILGDSISVGYTPVVKQLLEGKAVVSRPAENCQGTKLGVQRIDQWIGSEPWTVIHFNFGLHDLKHVDPVTGINSNKPDDPHQSDLKQYEANLKIIVERLKVTGAKLIFATSTPYPDLPEGPYRKAEDVLKYNEVARKIMKKNKIRINDLYSAVLPELATLQLPSNVHFKPEGNRFLGQKVTDVISSVLPS
ncbi:SGNH/GDSL hydrolase family protein [Larkinella terrae]|uniref:SGNH/GDSL hydrolase family protein n=1 Tax=Larkinella terrae TaxID=2025311 RepID=A0A7K0EG04_9BACT|nr:SGNH/GDSL hydrolase family protein [Larkinella terrae]MRS60378.1 SGNH/GDSL hydrolase family protein [Larkinella terrae]